MKSRRREVRILDAVCRDLLSVGTVSDLEKNRRDVSSIGWKMILATKEPEEIQHTGIMLPKSALTIIRRNRVPSLIR